MAKTFWILFFVVLISANLLIYLVSTDSGIEKKESENNKGYTEESISTLAKTYYLIFSGVILAAIAFIIITLVRQNMQVYY